MATRYGTSGAPCVAGSVPFSSQSRQPSLNGCAGPAREGCSAPDPAEGIPPPTRDGPIHAPARRRLHLGDQGQRHYPILVAE